LAPARREPGLTPAERKVLDALPVGLQIWEAAGDDPRSLVLVYSNPECDRQTGFELSADVGRPLAEIFPEASTDVYWEAVVAGEPRVIETRHSGDERLGPSWWRLKLAPYGERRALVSATNVTQAKAQARSLEASERLNRSILSGLQEGVVVVDTKSQIVLCNAAAVELFGAGELVGRALSRLPVDLLDDHGRLLADDKLPLARALRGQDTRGEIVRFVRQDGLLLWVEVNANPLVDDDGRIYGAVASYDDATVRVERDRRTRHEADTDPLTGLANRRALERTLEAALARAVASERSVGVLMLDLDGFKAVNDRHGHAAGDEVLREVARRLRRSVRERDLVARLGGDEFVVVLTGLGAVPDAVERVETALAEPFGIADGVAAPLGAAVGVAVFPADGANVADLLAVADREMYAAKGSRSLR
jgi:diguanylate cyclase (GGDEF)-like protein/PAS domain S-box-containing protein